MKKLPLLIAEVGGNHQGDFEYAKYLCQLACKSKADIVKLQCYSADGLVNPLYDLERHTHFKGFELTRTQYQHLAELVTVSGKEFLASIWDVDMYSWLNPYLQRYKIGSGDLTAYKIIRLLAENPKPLILSTGLSTLDDIKQSIDYIKSINSFFHSNNAITLLQCTSMYPIKHSEANLAVMHTYRKLFEFPVGYSDHTIGTKALELAFALGASVLEFHFTDKKEGRSFRDHQVSLTIEDIEELYQSMLSASELIGSDVKMPLPIEIKSNHIISFRRALYLNRDLPKGHVLAYDDLVELRPLIGIGAQHLNQVVGKTLNCDKNAFEAIHFSEFEP